MKPTLSYLHFAYEKVETQRVWGLPGSHCSVQFSSVAQSCLTLCNPMYCSTPGFSVRHQFPELAQTHVHQVSDAIQTSHLLLSPSPPAFSLSQNQGLFQGVSSSHQMAKVPLLKSGKLRWLVQVSTEIKTWNGNIITSFTTRIGLKCRMPSQFEFQIRTFFFKHKDIPNIAWDILMLVAQPVKNPPARQETQFRSLNPEDPLENGMVTHNSILAWEFHGQRNPVNYSPWGHRIVHNRATFISHTFMLTNDPLFFWNSDLADTVSYTFIC